MSIGKLKIVPVQFEMDKESVADNEVFTYLLKSLDLLDPSTNLKVNISMDPYDRELVLKGIEYFLLFMSEFYSVACYDLPEYISYSNPELNSDVYFINGNSVFVGYIKRDILIVPRDISASTETILVDRLDPALIIGI